MKKNKRIIIFLLIASVLCATLITAYMETFLSNKIKNDLESTLKRTYDVLEKLYTIHASSDRFLVTINRIVTVHIFSDNTNKTSSDKNSLKVIKKEEMKSVETVVDKLHISLEEYRSFVNKYFLDEKDIMTDILNRAHALEKSGMKVVALIKERKNSEAILSQINMIESDEVLLEKAIDNAIANEKKEVEIKSADGRSKISKIVMLKLGFDFIIVFCAILVFIHIQNLFKAANILQESIDNIRKGNYQKEIDSDKILGFTNIAKSFKHLATELKEANREIEDYSQKILDKNKELTVKTENLEKVKNELLKEKGFAKIIAENMEEGIMLLDLDYKILWANKKILNSAGLKLEDITGKNCYKVTHHIDYPCEAPDDICPVKEIFETGKPNTAVHLHKDKDGNEKYMEVCAYPVKDENGKIIQFVHVARNISDNKKLEDELNNKVKNLERFNRVAVGRELKMKELKAKIFELEKKIKTKDS